MSISENQWPIKNSVVKFSGGKLCRLSCLFLISGSLKLYSQDFDTLSSGKFKDVKVEVGTFLGNFQRNYYGNKAPSKLDILWKKFLGKGETVVPHKGGKTIWWGCGWTGQPLLVWQDDRYYLIQGAYDHRLKKIDANNGQTVWEYEYDDVLKGTGTIWANKYAERIDESLIILQGSRKGVNKFLSSDVVPSLRGISYFSGQELWRFDVKRTRSYSRDVDASALIFNDTVYIGLENATFVVLDPNPDSAVTENGMIQPKIYQELMLCNEKDIAKRSGNLVIESSPCLLNDRIYITSGSGHVYGYNLKTKTIDWDFYIGADLDGTPVVTEDSCLLVTVEKQYIEGKGGVFKLDPSESAYEAVVWYFPTGNATLEEWQGGIIGSVGVNDRTRIEGHPSVAAFIGIDGYLYVVSYKEIDELRGKVYGPDRKKTYPTPKLLFKKKIGASISTPIIVGDRLVAAGYGGIHLFEFDENGNFNLLDKEYPGGFESTPIAWDGKIYIGSRNGYLYCFGEAGNTPKTTNEENNERNNESHE